MPKQSFFPCNLCPWNKGNISALLDLAYSRKWVSHFHNRSYCCSLHISPQTTRFSVLATIKWLTKASTENQHVGAEESLHSATVSTGSSRLFPDLMMQFCSAAPILVLPPFSVFWRVWFISRRNVCFQPTPVYWRSTENNLTSKQNYNGTILCSHLGTYRRHFFPTVQTNGEEESLRTLWKVKFKGTHLGYHH